MSDIPVTEEIVVFQFKNCRECSEVATFRFVTSGMFAPDYFCFGCGMEELHVLAFDESCTIAFTLDVWPDGFLDDGRKVISLKPTVYDASSTKEAP